MLLSQMSGLSPNQGGLQRDGNGGNLPLASAENEDWVEGLRYKMHQSMEEVLRAQDREIDHEIKVKIEEARLYGSVTVDEEKDLVRQLLSEKEQKLRRMRALLLEEALERIKEERILKKWSDNTDVYIYVPDRFMKDGRRNDSPVHTTQRQTTQATSPLISSADYSQTTVRPVLWQGSSKSYGSSASQSSQQQQSLSKPHAIWKPPGMHEHRHTRTPGGSAGLQASSGSARKSGSLTEQKSQQLVSITSNAIHSPRSIQQLPSQPAQPTAVPISSLSSSFAQTRLQQRSAERSRIASVNSDVNASSSSPHRATFITEHRARQLGDATVTSPSTSESPPKSSFSNKQSRPQPPPSWLAELTTGYYYDDPEEISETEDEGWVSISDEENSSKEDPEPNQAWQGRSQGMLNKSSLRGTQGVQGRGQRRQGGLLPFPSQHQRDMKYSSDYSQIIYEPPRPRVVSSLNVNRRTEQSVDSESRREVNRTYRPHNEAWRLSPGVRGEGKNPIQASRISSMSTNQNQEVALFREGSPFNTYRSLGSITTLGSSLPPPQPPSENVVTQPKSSADRAKKELREDGAEWKRLQHVRGSIWEFVDSLLTFSSEAANIAQIPVHCFISEPK